MTDAQLQAELHELAAEIRILLRHVERLVEGIGPAPTRIDALAARSAQAHQALDPPAPHACSDCERTHPWRECPPWGEEP